MKNTVQKSTLSLVLVAGLAATAWSPASLACAQDPYVASICVMAMPNFTTGFNGYVLAAGQELPVSQNATLFALISTTYGGDGRTTFRLPDLRGRVIVGAGNSPQFGNFTPGQAGGSTGVVLNALQLPLHSHTLVNATVDISKMTATTTLTGLSASISGAAKLKASTATGNQGNPNGNYLGTTTTLTNRIYSDSAPTSVQLNPSSIDISGLTVGSFTGNPSTTLGGTATVTGSTGNTGSNAVVPTMMPYLSMYYYIATQGQFPAKN